jgi:predicted metal-dependent phosphoesterase TrpH
VPLYRVELHSHSKGDPIDKHLRHTLIEHIDRAKAVGLNAIAITWHQKVCAVQEAYDYARKRGILLIPGMEADVDNRHVVLLNLAEGDLPGESSWDQVRALKARKPDVFVLAPHPFYPHPSCLGSIMNDHVDLIDAVEWCMIHVNWLPSRVNPNLRAARWAQLHGKPLVACSDAHTLSAIGKNASTVGAEELTIDAIFAGIRAGRVSFHRRSLDFAPLVYSTGKAMSSQPRHIGRWVKAKWRSRRQYPSSSPANGAEAVP